MEFGVLLVRDCLGDIKFSKKVPLGMTVPF